jgi:hypothetical protein
LRFWERAVGRATRAPERDRLAGWGEDEVGLRKLRRRRWLDVAEALSSSAHTFRGLALDWRRRCARSVACWHAEGSGAPRVPRDRETGHDVVLLAELRDVDRGEIVWAAYCAVASVGNCGQRRVRDLDR